ncbi:ABC transporter ATP-binding protein [Variovorax sp. J22G73]|uniref:ABC transporter ATP-binding protein n=1 Tax=unclassified Variovorax TaxID=663243 RepID=UPI0025774CEE|nr:MULTISPECIES: ABC transporter ATP-binding protein [unclassified Variovorax]MDM0008152.1 ABC transporter ATP-binding protein [Variovorax sp. J22R203]MDM0100658.1 ABC transporter ATP-binding protein [Variovorax sp. J22G73]
MTEFVLESLGKTFAGAVPITALQGVSLRVRAGEFVCLLGASGCGKSTLLDILAGLERASTGTALFDGQPITGPDPRRGLVFQDPALFPWRTIAQNVGFGPELRGLGRRERRERAAASLARVGLAGFEDAYPHQLSGGMRQRAGIARALANDPEVLLMDEPFGAVDHLTRIALQEDLLRLWERERRTIVFVTHDVGEAVFLADRVVLMSPRPGRIHRIFDVAVPRARVRGQKALIEIEAQVYWAIQGMDGGDGVRGAAQQSAVEFQ